MVLGPAIYALWSPGGGTVVLFSGAGSVIPDGRCYLLPLERAQDLPRVPAGGFRSEEEIARLPGARRIDSSKRIYPGPGVDIYAFYRETVQRNLYRIPIQ